MTHEEAADVFECMGDDVSYLADYLSSKQIAAIPIAARVLRAHADGDMSFEEFREVHRRMNKTQSVTEDMRDAWRAGWNTASDRQHGTPCEQVRHQEEIASRDAENERLRAELETERMRLAACSVAALGYTHPQDEVHSDYRSASLDDVETLRKKHDELRAQLAAMTAEVVRMDNLITHLGEYWNGDENERAMSDACWHVISECDKSKRNRPADIAALVERAKEQTTPAQTAAQEITPCKD